MPKATVDIMCPDCGEVHEHIVIMGPRGGGASAEWVGAPE